MREQVLKLIDQLLSEDKDAFEIIPECIRLFPGYFPDDDYLKWRNLISQRENYVGVTFSTSSVPSATNTATTSTINTTLRSEYSIREYCRLECFLIMNEAIPNSKNNSTIYKGSELGLLIQQKKVVVRSVYETGISARDLYGVDLFFTRSGVQKQKHSTAEIEAITRNLAEHYLNNYRNLLEAADFSTKQKLFEQAKILDLYRDKSFDTEEIIIQEPILYSPADCPASFNYKEYVDLVAAFVKSRITAHSSEFSYKKSVQFIIDRLLEKNNSVGRLLKQREQQIIDQLTFYLPHIVKSDNKKRVACAWVKYSSGGLTYNIPVFNEYRYSMTSPVETLEQRTKYIKITGDKYVPVETFFLSTKTCDKFAQPLAFVFYQELRQSSNPDNVFALLLLQEEPQEDRGQNTGKRWTEDEELEVVEMYEKGIDLIEIARHFERSINSIKARLVNWGYFEYNKETNTYREIGKKSQLQNIPAAQPAAVAPAAQSAPIQGSQQPIVAEPAPDRIIEVKAQFVKDSPYRLKLKIRADVWENVLKRAKSMKISHTPMKLIHEVELDMKLPQEQWNKFIQEML